MTILNSTTSANSIDITDLMIHRAAEAIHSISSAADFSKLDLIDKSEFLVTAYAALHAGHGNDDHIQRRLDAQFTAYKAGYNSRKQGCNHEASNPYLEDKSIESRLMSLQECFANGWNDADMVSGT